MSRLNNSHYKYIVHKHHIAVYFAQFYSRIHFPTTVPSPFNDARRFPDLFFNFHFEPLYPDLSASRENTGNRPLVQSYANVQNGLV